MARRRTSRSRSASAQRARFKRAAKKCKGLPLRSFHACVRKHARK